MTEKLEKSGEGQPGEQQVQTPEKKFPVKEVCMYCKKVLSEAAYMSDREGEVTHGACPDCGQKALDRFFASQGKGKADS